MVSATVVVVVGAVVVVVVVDEVVVVATVLVVLEEIWAFKFEHFLHALLCNHHAHFTQTLRRALSIAKFVFDQVLGVLLKQRNAFCMLYN